MDPINNISTRTGNPWEDLDTTMGLANPEQHLLLDHLPMELVHPIVHYPSQPSFPILHPPPYPPPPPPPQQHRPTATSRCEEEERGEEEEEIEEEEGGQDEEVEEEEEEKLGAVKEMMYRIAAMQPVDIDPETIKKPQRRNVRISDDPQSVAARLRRERISKRIRILQRLVPGGTKMDTASMLDEAVRYVKFLKRQLHRLQQQQPPPPPPPPPPPHPAPPCTAPSAPSSWPATVGTSCSSMRVRATGGGT